MIKDILLYGLPCFTRVRGHSMLPTLRDGQCYMYNPFVNGYERGHRRYRFLKRNPHRFNRGDIVIAEVDGDRVIKRVIAVGGDKLHITRTGRVTVNGVPLYEPYTVPSSRADKPYNEVIPERHIWLMGDNRGASTDSRSFGAVNENAVMGKLIRREGTWKKY